MGKMTLEQMVNYCSTYGFIYQGSGLYGGLANTWDYGPLGIRLKNNIKDAWRHYFIQSRDRSYELDSSILLHPKVWEASGHVENFSDPLVDCKSCKVRHRADHFIQELDEQVNPDQMSIADMQVWMNQNQPKCPACGGSEFTNVRQFQLMFQTKRGSTRENEELIYLRPENAQGEYINYQNILRTMRTKIPFGIGQIGKVFRNEITPGQFIFRTVEFEQMEYQQFCRPGTEMDFYESLKQWGMNFYLDLGIREKMLRFKDHDKLAHYAKAACDIEYKFPQGWGEINGTHNRSDYDLRRHQDFSGKNMLYYDEEQKQHYLPQIIESTYGVDRTFLALLFDSLAEEELADNSVRQILKIKSSLAPYQVAVLPLIKSRHSEKAASIYRRLRSSFMTVYEESGSIGKRYRRGDCIGTPYAITIDNDTIEKDIVTLRFRDSMEQIKLEDRNLEDYLRKMLFVDQQQM